MPATLSTEMGELQERITTPTKGSITSAQAIYVPADDLTDPAPAAFAHLDATTVLSRDIAAKGIYPSVDPLDSTSRLLDPQVVGVTKRLHAMKAGVCCSLHRQAYRSVQLLRHGDGLRTGVRGADTIERSVHRCRWSRRRFAGPPALDGRPRLGCGPRSRERPECDPRIGGAGIPATRACSRGGVRRRREAARMAEDKGMEVFSLWSPQLPGTEIDLFVTEPFPFDEMWERAAKVELGACRVAVASVEDLIVMKERAGRPKDLLDVAALKNLQTERGGSG